MNHALLKRRDLMKALCAGGPGPRSHRRSRLHRAAAGATRIRISGLADHVLRLLYVAGVAEGRRVHRRPVCEKTPLAEGPNEGMAAGGSILRARTIPPRT